MKINNKIKLGITVGIILLAGLFGHSANALTDEEKRELIEEIGEKCQQELRDACQGKLEDLHIEIEGPIDFEDPYIKHLCFNAIDSQACFDKYWIPKQTPEGTTDECGNNACDVGENCSSCLADCPCSSEKVCQTSDSQADANGCVISEMDLTVTTDKKTYSPQETVIIQGSVSDTKGGLDGAVVALEVSNDIPYSATASATADSAGNYRLEFPIPSNITQAVFTLSATTSYSSYPSASQSTSFVVGEIGIQLEENAATGEPFIGAAADGTSSLDISISLPGCSKGCSNIKLSQPDIGKLEGEAIDVGGNVTLDSTGAAKITYRAPDYLTKDQLTRSLDVHQSGSKTWAAGVPLILTYTDANDQAGKIESEILVYRPPVMLVHGFLGATATWDKMSTYLRGEKFDTYTGNYGATDQSIEGLSLVLKNDIQKQKADYANANIKLAKVDAVGHSMGGLISRYYSHNLPDYPDDLRKLIMVGTPNHGVSWTKKITGSIGAGWYQAHRLPAEQLYSESSFIKTLNSGESTGAHLNSAIQYGNIYGWPDDWVVSAASAYLNGVNSVSESDVKHSSDISGVPAVAITEYLNTWEQVKNWLISDIYQPSLKGSRAEVYKYSGDVYSVDYDSSGGQENKLTSSPTKFDSWQGLRTGSDATAIVHLTIDDLPWGVIFLDPDSEIFLGYLSPQLVEVRLWKGKAAFRSKQDGHFTVPVNIKRSENGEWWKYSPQAVVTGRNTEFTVTAGENIAVHSLEGELVVNTPNATKEGTVLAANKSVAVDGEEIVAINPVSQDDFWWSTADDDFLDSTSTDSWLNKLISIGQGIKTNLMASITFIIAIISLLFFIFFAVLKFARKKIGIGILMLALGFVSFCIFVGVTWFFASANVNLEKTNNEAVTINENNNSASTNTNTSVKTDSNPTKSANTNTTTSTNTSPAKKSSTVTVAEYGFTLEVGEDQADKIRPVAIDPGSFAEASYIFCYDTKEENEEVIYCDPGEAPVFSVDIMTQAQWEETATSSSGEAYLSMAEKNGLYYIFSHPSDTLPSDVPATQDFYNQVMGSIKFSD
ncbi:MAG: alpha/beta fold hydrolase [Parcubacteria group bacterium]